MRVAVQVPAFEEGEDMLPALRSIQDQRVPGYVDEISYETWVTLSPPNRELCSTWQAALRAEGFEPFEAPQGKLSARNAAHDSAVERGYDVIVTWDADAPALHDESLSSLLAPFEDSDVIVVRGEPVSPANLFGMVENVTRKLVSRPLRNHLHGQLSAFTAEGWRKAGPFDTDLDQTEIKAVWNEEEYDFSHRLQEHGRLAHAGEAAVHNDSRRTECRFERAFAFSGRQLSDWCDSRGEKTFAPRRDRRRNRYR